MSKIQMQCRRGMLELDFIFQRFLSNQYEQLSHQDKFLFSALLDQEDPILYDWLVVDIDCTDASLQPMVACVKKSMAQPWQTENNDKRD